jgi:hypothetical protein
MEDPPDLDHPELDGIAGWGFWFSFLGSLGKAYPPIAHPQPQLATSSR